MPFIGFLGPTWEPTILTRILHRQNEYYHRINEYSSIISIIIHLEYTKAQKILPLKAGFIFA